MMAGCEKASFLRQAFHVSINTFLETSYLTFLASEKEKGVKGGEKL